MVKRAYTEGDWFGIPLRGGGFAIGLVARVNRQRILLGYFFGPRSEQLPSLADATGLRPEAAVLVGRFGHLGLRGGSWPILGHESAWDRSIWPGPAFVRYEELTGRTFLVRYDDDDPNRVVGEVPVKPGLAEHGPKDGLMGAGFVERTLSALLG